MSVPILNQARAVIDAMEESSVRTILALYQNKAFGPDIYEQPKREAIQKLLEMIGMGEEAISYWMEQFFAK